MMTVLFATRNGAYTLPGVLEAYCRLQTPPGGWKLIVVDNGSTDGTAEILASFLDRLPLTSLFEDKPGKNAAINTGLSSVEGDLVVFTDDDVFPRANWLARMRAAADLHPSYSILGGVVLPRWEVPPREWVLSWVPPGPVFTLTDPSVHDGPTGPHNVFGPNMGVRTEVLESGHRFDVSIGPRKGQYPMGSETEFVRRLMRQGHTAWFVADAVVEHFIREFQMQEDWVLARAIRFGRGQYRLAQAEPRPTLTTWLGVPRYLFRCMLTQGALMLKPFLCFDEEGLFRARWQFNYLWGQAVESRAVRVETAKGIGLSESKKPMSISER